MEIDSNAIDLSANDYDDIEDVSITPAKSAYMYFSGEYFPIAQAMLANEGFGDWVKEVSKKWKSMSDVEKQPYLQSALKDRNRFDAENAELDRLASERQRLKRQENEFKPESTRFRSATIAQTKISSKNTVKSFVPSANDIAKRKRDVEIQESVKQQSEQAGLERLKYLMSKSPAFKKFGLGKTMTSSSSSSIMEPSSPRTITRRTSLSSQPSTAEEESTVNHKQDDEEEIDVELTSQPTCMNNTSNLIMRPYQISGLNFLIQLHKNSMNGILGDEMGLGKTIQALSVLAWQYETEGVRGPHLVVVPKSTMMNWKREVDRWLDSNPGENGLIGLVFHDEIKQERERKLQEDIAPYYHTNSHQKHRKWDILITSYQIVNIHITQLKKIHWKYLIVDEAHRMKNEASLLSKNLRELVANDRLLLTGTPLQNNLHELWALLNFLAPEVFADDTEFAAHFEAPLDEEGGDLVEAGRIKREEQEKMCTFLSKILQFFMIRRLKEDVEGEIPEKKEIFLFCKLTGPQLDVYKKLLKKDWSGLVCSLVSSSSSSSSSSDGDSRSALSGSKSALNNIVMQLRKACLHPYLFPGIEDMTNLDPFGRHLIDNSVKLRLLEKLLINKHNETRFLKTSYTKNKVLLFSQFTTMLDILEDFLRIVGYGYCRLDGSTSYADREEQIDQFHTDPDKFVFLLSTRAGGLGLNLQVANIVIMFDSDWNPQVDLQAEDRAHRIGQTRTVQVYRFVVEDSVEYIMLQRAQEKLLLSNLVIEKTGASQREKKDQRERDLYDAVRIGLRHLTDSGSDCRDEFDDFDGFMSKSEARTNTIKSALTDSEERFKLRVFDGVDYSSITKDIIEQNEMILGEDKREKKRRMNQESVATAESVPKQPRSLIPKDKRARRFEEFQLIPIKRIKEIEVRQNKIMELTCSSSTSNAPNMTRDGLEQVESCNNPETNALLMREFDALQAEKSSLIDGGFPAWTKFDVDALTDHLMSLDDDSQFDALAVLSRVGDNVVSVGEVSRYLKSLIRLAKAGDGFAVRQIIKVTRSRDKRREMKRKLEAMNIIVSRFQPHSKRQLGLPIATQAMFTPSHDRHLLCLVHKYGYGNWNDIQTNLLMIREFQFDYIFQSHVRNVDFISHRADQLLSACERQINNEQETRVRLAAHEVQEVDMKIKLDVLKRDLAVQQSSASSDLSSSISSKRKAVDDGREAGPDKRPLLDMTAATTSTTSITTTTTAAACEMDDQPIIIDNDDAKKKKKNKEDQMAKMEAIEFPPLALTYLCTLIETNKFTIIGQISEAVVLWWDKKIEKQAADEGVTVGGKVKKAKRISKRQVEFRTNQVAEKDKRIWRVKDEFKGNVDVGLLADDDDGEEKKSQSVK